MLLHFWCFILFSFYHGLEIYIYLDASQFVVGFSFNLELASLFHFQSSCFPVQFDLVNLISGWSLLNHVWLRNRIWFNNRARHALREVLACLSKRHDAELLLKTVLSFLCGTVGWQSFLFKFVKDCFSCHCINCLLFLVVFDFGLFNCSLYTNRLGILALQNFWFFISKRKKLLTFVLLSERLRPILLLGCVLRRLIHIHLRLVLNRIHCTFRDASSDSRLHSRWSSSLLRFSLVSWDKRMSEWRLLTLFVKHYLIISNN